MARAGHQVGAAQGGRHQGPPESESPQEGLAVPGGLTGGRMVGEQGRQIRHGQCPILLGTPGSPSPQCPLQQGGSKLGGGAVGNTPGLGHPA